ncbi:hypothetical protein Tco_0026549 [Tanacetum coccineum]
MPTEMELTLEQTQQGVSYEVSNKDKKNKLMRIDELHKFSDSTLDISTLLLNDSPERDLDGNLPQTIIWNRVIGNEQKL